VKIALVSPYDFAYPGGVVNHILALEQHFTNWGHEVKIIAPASKAVTNLEGRFIPVGTPRPVPTSGSIARITLSPWLSSKIKAVLAEEKFDIIHLHEPLMPMLCTTVLRLSDTATVGTFHACQGRPSYRLGRPVTTFFLKKWFRKLDGKIAVSVPAMEYARKHLLGFYDIIPNGINSRDFCPDVPPIGKFCDGKLNVLFVGRLERRKGLNYLLKAYRQVQREVPDSRLIIVGPGTRLKPWYQAIVRRYRLKNVTFVGYVSCEELPRYYKTADVFCAPATGRESFGIVLLEAMSLGKPVVASNIEGYASVITDGVDGLLVPPKDTKALAGALVSVMTDESLRWRLGAKAKARALEYDWDHIARQVMDYYIKVLREPPWRERYRPPAALSVLA
jgi:phosphatidylinositol alpha-mannosyltransferase